MSILLKAGLIGGSIAVVIGALIIFRTSITSALASGGQTIGEGVGGFFGGIGQGITESFSQFEFPSFDFGGNGDGNGAGESELAGQTVPFGEEGGTVTIPADTVVNPDGTVTSSTPPTATDPDLSAIQKFTLMQKGFFESVAEVFSFGSVESAIETAIDQPNVTDLPAAEDFQQATQALLASLENPDIVGDEPIAFFNVFEDIAPLPLSQFAIDFFENVGQTPEFAFSIPSFARFNAGGA